MMIPINYVVNLRIETAIKNSRQAPPPHPKFCEKKFSIQITVPLLPTRAVGQKKISIIIQIIGKFDSNAPPLRSSV